MQTDAPVKAPLPETLFGYDRRLLIIFVIVVVNLLGFGIIIPLLPFYAQSLGATPLTIGLIFSTFSVCQLISNPVLGAWSDRFGRRPILLYSILGTAASFALLAIANSLWMLFVARVVDGLSGGNISTARAYIADVTEAADRPRAYGLLGAAFGLGFVLGPAMGGALARFGYAAPAWVAAALALVASALAWLWLPETSRKDDAKQRHGAWTELLKRPLIAPILALDLFYWVAFAAYQTTFALFVAQRFHFEVTGTGATLAVVGLVNGIVQVRAVGPLAARIGELKTLALGLALAGLGMLAIAFATDLALFYPAVVLSAAGIGLAGPSIPSLISQAADPSEQGRLQGISSALESLGRSAGPALGNGGLGLLGEGAPYVVGGLLLLVLAVAGLRLATTARASTARRPPGLAA